MRTTIPTPEFKINKRMVSPLEIDMYNIKGPYEDGEWHTLIHECTKKWAAKNQFSGKGTLWSSVMPSANFESYYDVCVITSFGMAGFMKELEITLGWQLRRKVRRSDEMQVKRGIWRPYLHLEQGKIWIVSDAAEWEELE